MPKSEQRRLARTVYVNDPDTGLPARFGPDDEVPDWAAEQITNEGAWEDDETDVLGAYGTEGGPPVPGRGQSARDEEIRRASIEEAGHTYGTWKVDDLRAELEERGLPSDGKKDELVERLAEADRDR